VSYLIHEDYRVVNSEMNVYDCIHLEFANGCHIYQDYSDLKDDLFYRFAFMTFDYYEDIRRQAGIVDEPEGCKEKTFTPSESCFTRVTIRTKWWNTTSKNTFCPQKKWGLCINVRETKTQTHIIFHVLCSLYILYDVITNIEDGTLQHPNSSSALSWP